MNGEDLRTEVTLGRVLTTGTRASTACLAAGLMLTFFLPEARVTALLLTAGLIVLMATPATRVIVSVVEFARQRDWLFVLYTFIVLALLVGSLVVAVI
jgi:Protein of unknown function (DUF1634)